MNKKIGKQTVKLSKPPVIISAYSSAGSKEGEGPLKDWFDDIYPDEFLGEDSWEKAESKLVTNTVDGAVKRSGLKHEEIEYIFAGDLLNQCTGSSFGVKNFQIPFFGLYGACSTMGESLSLASMIVEGGFAKNVIAATSSHFCSSEKQFRFPLEYGGVRTPTSQWTVTGSGAAVLSDSGDGPKITHVTTGKIIDLGVTDANNMGAAMAPAAADTIYAHLTETGRNPEYYDHIVTGDLGVVGSKLLIELLIKKGVDISRVHTDCGSIIFDKSQNVQAGGSGCGCAASVFCGHFYKKLKSNEINRILFVPTGALMSPTSSFQGLSIPGIAHGLSIENVED